MAKAEAQQFLSGDLMWPDAVFGPWHLVFHWASIGGRMECVGIDVRSFWEKRGPGGGVAARGPWFGGRYRKLDSLTWRKIHTLEAAARELWADNWLPAIADSDALDLTDENRDAARRVASEVKKPSRRLDRGHLEKVARIYRDAVTAGRTDPSRAVQEQFPWATPTAVRKWVARCRADDLKLLPKAQPRQPNRPEDITKPKRRKGTSRG